MLSRVTPFLVAAFAVGAAVLGAPWPVVGLMGLSAVLCSAGRRRG